MEPISPSVWRSARRNTVRRVSAVKIARGAYQGCPPRVVRGRLRPPGRDRLLREPDRQAPALTQADVLRAPVRHPVPLLGEVRTASGVGLERHRNSRGSWVGAAPYPTHPARPSGPPPWPPARSCPSKAARRPPARCAGPPGRRHPGSRGARGVFLVTIRPKGGHSKPCLTRRCRLLVPTVLPRGQPYRSVQQGRHTRNFWQVPLARCFLQLPVSPKSQRP